MHRTTRHFWRCYDTLPFEIQKVPDQSFILLQRNPRHPSLHFKKTGTPWSARVGIHHRALAAPDPNGFLWVWIGRQNAKRILDKIDVDLADNPERFPALTGPFAGLRKFRVGDYRVIFAIMDSEVLVLRVQHRKDIYRG